ncbi:hypothetical protein D3C72_1351190 [compost metagenome]
MRLALGGLQAYQQRCVEQAVGQRLPAADFQALAPALRDQPADRRQGVDIFDDHARIEDRAAVFHDQARHFAERVELADPGLGRPDILFDELALDLFLRHHHAHLARVGTGPGCIQLHILPLSLL